MNAKTKVLLSRLRTAHYRAMSLQQRYFWYVGTTTGNKAHARMEHWIGAFDRIMRELEEA